MKVEQYDIVFGKLHIMAEQIEPTIKVTLDDARALVDELDQIEALRRYVLEVPQELVSFTTT